MELPNNTYEMIWAMPLRPQRQDAQTVLLAQLRELRYATPHELPLPITPVADCTTLTATFRPVWLL